MDRPEFVTSIRNSWSFLSEVTLEETFASPDPLPTNDQFRDLVLSGTATHLDIFSFCLSNSHYNFMIFDHSCFQFSWSNNGDVRYAFYPNPHVSHAEAVHSFRKYRGMLQKELISSDEFQGLATALGARGNVPIFRFEYAVSQYVALAHPCAHFHIGVHGDNRWAVRRVLTPLAFTMLIVKHYYPEEWSLGFETVGAVTSNAFERRLKAERLNCRLIAPEYFCEEEELNFHFA